MAVVDQSVRPGVIDGLYVISAKQAGDDRGTVRELFRRSAFAAAGLPDLGSFAQVNATESARGVIRGLHAESMTKLVAVVAGEAYGAYVDGRRESPTFGQIDTVRLVPGIEVLVPAGVANGFQALAEPTVYVYCFDLEWQPGMPGWACNPLDAALGLEWPVPIDAGNPAQLSAKDAEAPTFARVFA